MDMDLLRGHIAWLTALQTEDAPTVAGWSEDVGYLPSDQPGAAAQRGRRGAVLFPLASV
jgi:hypothetical protein